MRRKWTHTWGKKVHREEKIASIRGKKPYLHLVIFTVILEEMADHTFDPSIMRVVNPLVERKQAFYRDLICDISCGYTCLLPKVTLWVIALGWDRFGFPVRFSPPVTLQIITQGQLLTWQYLAGNLIHH